MSGVLSPDGKSVVFSLERKIQIESLSPRAPIKTLELEESRKVAGVYYDSAGRPKALVIQQDDKSAGAELWDVLSGERDWRAENVQEIWESSVTSSQLFLAWRDNDAGQAGFCSLESGRLLETAKLLNMNSPFLSADGRFLAFRSLRPSILGVIVPASLVSKYYTQMAWLQLGRSLFFGSRCHGLRWSCRLEKPWPELGKLGDAGPVHIFRRTPLVSSRLGMTAPMSGIYRRDNAGSRLGRGPLWRRH